MSTAWVRYVQALKRPVDGVSFGDPALQLKPPTPMKILADAPAAPSLAAHVDAIASVNPFYAALREPGAYQAQRTIRTFAPRSTGCGWFRRKAARSSSMSPTPS